MRAETRGQSLAKRGSGHRSVILMDEEFHMPTQKLDVGKTTAKHAELSGFLAQQAVLDALEQAANSPAAFKKAKADPAAYFSSYGAKIPAKFNATMSRIRGPFGGPFGATITIQVCVTVCDWVKGVYVCAQVCGTKTVERVV